VNCGHNAVSTPKAWLIIFTSGSEAGCRAGGVRHDFYRLIILFVVDTHDNHGRVLVGAEVTTFLVLLRGARSVGGFGVFSVQSSIYSLRHLSTVFQRVVAVEYLINLPSIIRLSSYCNSSLYFPWSESIFI
jgi:hypothetical protein